MICLKRSALLFSAYFLDLVKQHCFTFMDLRIGKLMLHAIFLILLLQLVGEFLQKYFVLAVPGPVLGLLILLGLLLAQRSPTGMALDFRQRLITTATSLLEHLSLLFVPIGVGVVMHLQLLESQLVKVLSVVIFGTMATLIFTSFLFQVLTRRDGK